MYSEITQKEGTDTLEKYLENFNTIGIHPTNFIMKLLRLVMENNIFQFGNTF